MNEDAQTKRDNFGFTICVHLRLKKS